MPESSSSTDIPEGHVVVGRIGKPHGLRGECYVFPETDNPGRFVPGASVHVGGVETTVTSSWTTENRLIVGTALATDRAGAEELRGAPITIPEGHRRRLGEDEWWPDELVGLEVYDHAGIRCGRVVAYVEGVAQDRLVVDTGAGRVEIPFVSALVPVVDTEAARIVLGDVEGLLTAG